MRVPIAREGWAFIVPPLAAGGVAGLTGHPLAAAVLGAATLFLVQFFRDPERRPEGGDDTLISPADGTVLSVAEAPEAPPGARRRLSVFMSVFNCHVNRAPASGRLADYAYVRGQKGAAFSDKASAENEQNRITLVTPSGSVTFKQIAGALARRIIFYPRVGDTLVRGQRIGLIRFGSRVDLFVPDGAEVLVGPGDKLKAGQTAIARWPRGA
ncbi:MAG TPA: phosphatidylserine decarboxylase [Thermoanaerobaculia bacterium]|nr:phosphatidylserine decarboxylase [Thermoanaerobaculia bacterium]